jgi:hypothetical protein
MNDINYIGGDELVFTNEDGIHSGGFSVNSIMMKAGMSPIMTLNSQYGGGDKVSDLFNNLVIPNWALSYGNKLGGSAYEDSNDEYESDEDIDDDLHDKLIDLVRHHENNKQNGGEKNGGEKNGGEKKKKTQKQKQKQKVSSKKGGTKKNK